jgi:pimeloyl-ACP methyl ester carboxylesterase
VPTVRTANGAEIAYESFGAGPLLVLAHGITEDRHTWDPLIEHLALDAKVVAVDLRGHGASSRTPPYDAFTMAADLHAVVEQVGGREPLMVGHSLGGAVVSAYASAYPARGVVNVDQVLMLGTFRALLLDLEPALRGDDATLRATIDAMFATLDGALPESERARIAAIGSPEQHVVLGVWDLVLTTDAADLDARLAEVAAAIDAPYLALHGRDPGPDYAGWLARVLPDAVLEVWPEVGHYPHLVEPERFLARLHEFDHEL